MHKRLLSVLALVSLIGCVDHAAMQGMPAEECAGVASLRIDPLGRGDGIDITESNYHGSCYEDDDMEANRPLVDHWQVAADEAAAIAAESRALADAHRAHVESIEAYITESLYEQANPEPGFATAWYAYVALVTAANSATEDAYQIGLELLAPEKKTSWQDVANYPDAIIGGLAAEFREGIVQLSDTPMGLEVAGEVLSRAIKAAMLDFLKEARDTARAAFEALPDADQSASSAPQPTVDPGVLALLNGAKQGYEEALAQAAADSRAAIEASMAARNAVSEQPPCNSDELREYLDYWLCQIEFINPVTAEQEADNPGITATIDEYVAEVCEAVSLECVQEA